MAIEDTGVYQPYKSSAEEDFKKTLSRTTRTNSHKLPPYPIEVLLLRIIASSSTATQTPPDIVAQLAFAVIEQAWLKVCSMREGWLEQISLYTVVLDPAREKAVFSQIIEPLRIMNKDS